MKYSKITKTMFAAITLLFVATFVSGCSVRDTEEQPKASSENSSSSGAVTAPSYTVPSYSAPNYQKTTPTFHGSTCTGDCSGHEAGYDWAEEKGIDDPDDCGGNSQSFIEGCESYAEEQQSYYDDYEDDDAYSEDDYDY